MRIFLISDNNDTLEGMRLAGVEGVVVHKKDEILDALKRASKNSDIGLILITPKSAEQCRDYINAHRSDKYPLIAEIPDRHLEDYESPLTDYIRDTLGIG